MIESLDVVRVILDILNGPIPKTATQLARELIERGIYQSKYPNKLGAHLKMKYLQDLVNSNYLVMFSPQTQEWKDAKTLNTVFFRIKPRKAGELYQTNFVYAFSNGDVKYLPNVPPGLNLAAMALLHRLIKRSKATQNHSESLSVGENLLNLIYCGKFQETRNNIRLALYKSRIDYSTIDLLEKLLDFALNLPEIPFKPDMAKATSFLHWISSVGESDSNQVLNTGSKGGPGG